MLTGAGQAVAGGLDLRGIFDPSPGPGHVPTFPATLPLAAAAFAVMLQLTLVGEGWPLRRLPARLAGALALAVSWAVALALYFALVRIEPPPGSGVRRAPARWRARTSALRSSASARGRCCASSSGAAGRRRRSPPAPPGWPARTPLVLGAAACSATLLLGASLERRTVTAAGGLLRGRRAGRGHAVRVRGGAPRWRPRRDAARPGRGAVGRALRARRRVHASRARRRTTGSRTRASTRSSCRSSCTSRSAAAGRSRRPAEEGEEHEDREDVPRHRRGARTAGRSPGRPRRGASRDHQRRVGAAVARAAGRRARRGRHEPGGAGRRARALRRRRAQAAGVRLPPALRLPHAVQRRLGRRRATPRQRELRRLDGVAAVYPVQAIPLGERTEALSLPALLRAGHDRRRHRAEPPRLHRPRRARRADRLRDRLRPSRPRRLLRPRLPRHERL